MLGPARPRPEEVAVLVRLRLSVPDRPGSLGLVASAIGAAGGDIARVDVLESEGGRALDDVFCLVHDAAHLQRVTERLAEVRGVTVTGAQHPAPPTAGHADLELVAQCLRQPAEALRILVDGLPHAAGADWAVLLDHGDGRPALRLTSATAPAEPDLGGLPGLLRLAPVRLPGGAGALLPLGATAYGVLVVRAHGPAFHRSELWRLGQIGEVVSAVVLAAAPS